MTGLEAAIGVTRVARVTGLDRTGVEVACAVRPRGHVLQVSNGKGETFAEARQGAVLEAAELAASERVVGPLWFAPLEALDGDALGADELGSAGTLVAPELWSPRVVCAWTRGEDLLGGGPVWVPAQAAWCPPPAGPSLGPVAVAWTTNGMGAHRQRERALEHALLEAIERHELATALPQGFTRAEVRERMLAPESVPPAVRRLAARIEEGGFSVYLFDATPEGGLRLPVAAALLVDGEGGPVPLTAGYACAFGRERALRQAVLEAAQSRLTDVHGAREDVAARPARGGDAELASWCRAARPSRSVREMPDLRARSTGELLERLRAGGFSRAVALRLAPPGFGIHVIKVVIPGFQVSPLL